MIPVKTRNCTQVNDGKHLTVTTKEFVGTIEFDGNCPMVFPPHSKVSLCNMEFGRAECHFESIGRQVHDADFSGTIKNININGVVLD